MCRTIERALRDSDIHAIRASPLTGTLLLHFNPALPLTELRERIERLLRSGWEASPPTDLPSRAQPAWHALPPEEVLRAFETSTAGLSAEHARERLARHGGNVLPPSARRSQLAMLLEQVRSLPVVLLAGATLLSLATGGGADALVILAVICLNAGIGFASESRTERIIGSLSLPLQRRAQLRRDGLARPVETSEIVPGDVMVLRPGTIVAADGRVIEADALSLDESLLTGESLPVAKEPTPVPRDRPLAERSSMVYRSTAVVGGSGLAVAVATGRRTEAGEIQALVGTAETPQTPMQRQLDVLGRQLVLLSLTVCGAVLALGLLRGRGFASMLKSAVALAVAAIPEGLPTVGTAALALGIEKMRRQEVLVRRLRAVETLAAVDVIAFDKTGTLTENRMSAAEVACIGQRLSVAGGALSSRGKPLGRVAPGSALARLIEVAVLCNEAVLAGDTITGSSTEAALLRLALDAGIDAAALRARLPRRMTTYRAEGRQYMASIHAASDGVLIACKGNPEQVLARCVWAQKDAHRIRLDARMRARLRAENRKMGERGLRVLGFAYAEATSEADGKGEELIWLGLVGLRDPARQGMSGLLSRLDRAGIRVIMVTGDQPATARAVAESLDLANGEPIATLDRGHLDDADERTVAALLRETRVFARATPADKLRITRALQRSGHIVALTGDGINDSPALRAANIGIVMGLSGTDGARAVADIVLASDDLPAIVTALELGRTTYANIRKSIHFLLATNFSEILVVLLATALGLGQVLTPLQLLWINLISDVLPALGLALEPAEHDVLDRGPHPAETPILGRPEMAVLAREGAAIAAGALASYGLGMARHGDAARAGTMAFSSLVGGQLLNAVTARSAHTGFFGSEPLPANRPLAAALLGSAALQLLLLTFPPLRRFMGMARLDLGDAAASAAGAILPYIANEAAKALPAGSRRSASSPARR